MILYPNAKVNLGLNILSKRPDSFHNISTCFYPVSWCDILEILPNKESLLFESSGIEIPGSTESNLCCKAFELLEKDFAIAPVHIHLHKIIPIGAGLGGGSSDAAFMLKGLNELYNLNLSTKELQSYASKLGSDCPFFIENKPMLAYGKGDELENFDFSLAGYQMLLVYPHVHSSTKEAYNGIVPQDTQNDLKFILNQPINKWHNQLKNDFEKSIFALYSEVEKVKQVLYDFGAEYACMSGSGSTLFGIFKVIPEEIHLPLEKYYIKAVNL